MLMSTPSAFQALLEHHSKQKSKHAEGMKAAGRQRSIGNLFRKGDGGGASPLCLDKADVDTQVLAATFLHTTPFLRCSF
jgi:hypothetical protein